MANVLHLYSFSSTSDPKCFTMASLWPIHTPWGGLSNMRLTKVSFCVFFLRFTGGYFKTHSVYVPILRVLLPKLCFKTWYIVWCHICCGSLLLSFAKAADSSGFCILFIIFRQPVDLDSGSVWAAPSFRFTSNPLLVWWQASCGTPWPEHSGFESPFSSPATSSSSWAAVRRHASKLILGGELCYFFNSRHLRRRNTESQFFTIFVSFARNSLQPSALSPPHLSVLLFLNSAVWGRLAHQYTIRGGG